jgi:two-component system NtrC family response regulator
VARVLIVDDEGKMRALLAMALDSESHVVEEAASAEVALSILESFGPDVIVTDIRMGAMTGIELVASARKACPDIECIVMTAFADARTGIEAMRAGAFDYVTKPFEMDEILLLVKRAAEKRMLKNRVTDLETRYSLNRIIASSKPMRKVIEQACMVAKRPTTVLILGKSGTGKEVVARGIHAESGREPFVAVNCGALTETLLESELFGHEKGSFTGAVSQKKGLFEQAMDGTIFLDEIGDVSQRLQVKLLRVLQEHEFTRVGGSATVRTNARVIAATNRNLEEAVKNNEFREDLYYRLCVFPVVIPSLVERLEDVPALVDWFLKKFNHTAEISTAALTCLEQYAWPGNVRELENCIERAIIVSGDARIEPGHLPEHIRENRRFEQPRVVQLPQSGLSLDDVEKQLIEQALERTAGNKTKAAGLLGISRRAMYSKMKTHGIAGASGSDESENDDDESE